jgi:hypothetical protein
MSARTKKPGGLRSWLPWHAFHGLGVPWRAQDLRDMSPRDVRYNALVLLAALLVIATCAAAYAVPHVSLLIDLGGGLATATIVLCLTGQWQELRRGLQESGHWPAADVQWGMICQYVLAVLVQAQERRRQRRLTERAASEEAHE